MQVQKSFQHDKSTLFLVSTPIGNLSDMTPRAVEVLRSVALVASEDTRVTKKLCHYFEISTPLISYHEHNKHQKTEVILAHLEAGDDVALVSDAGMPLVSDPGDKLVESALAAGFAVVPIPGANAVMTALIASGLSVQPFLFYGFLQRQKSKKKAQLLTLEKTPATLIFYESPHRLKETLMAILEVFGNRRAVVARELTKKFETFLRGTITDLLDYLAEGEVKGEVVLLVSSHEQEAQLEIEYWWKEMSLGEHVEYYIAQGLKKTAAIKQVATDLGQDRQAIYKAYHEEDEEEF